eukprot:366308-Chlamydomonas_euryale.AAC.10
MACRLTGGLMKGLKDARPGMQPPAGDPMILTVSVSVVCASGVQAVCKRCASGVEAAVRAVCKWCASGVQVVFK